MVLIGNMIRELPASYRAAVFVRLHHLGRSLAEPLTRQTGGGRHGAG